ncbi:SET domain-containing protein [Brevibacillus ruminantium]
MMHPDTELRFMNEEIGYGVFATKLIPKGTIVWVLDDLDQVLEPEYVAALDELRKRDVIKYSFRNQHGQYILCWDKARFVNHSFHANCVGTMYDMELAARDILPGEQLTDDYGTLNLDEPFACMPEEGTDRRCVLPDDLLRYYQQWDQMAGEAFAALLHVPQPLLPLIRPVHRERVRAVAENQTLLDSIRHLYFNRSSEPENQARG